jgi:hypothetical protein
MMPPHHPWTVVNTLAYTHYYLDPLGVNGQKVITGAAFDSLANTSIKPLLRFIATECITSMRPSPEGSRSDFAIVDFVVQLLVANKDRLEHDLRCPILPAEPGCYLPRVPSSLHAATRLDETGDSAAKSPDDTQITTAQVDALKAHPRDLDETASSVCSAAPAASHHAQGIYPSPLRGPSCLALSISRW